MELLNGLLSKATSIDFFKMDQAFQQARESYPNYSMFIEYLRFRYNDSYDMQLYVDALSIDDIKNKTTLYQYCIAEYSTYIHRLYGPFLTGRDTDAIHQIVDGKTFFEIIEAIIKSSDLDNEHFKFLLKQANKDNIYDFYQELCLQTMENPKLGKAIPRARCEEDVEYIVWNYVNLRHEQDQRPWVNIHDWPKEDWPKYVEKYKKDEIENPQEPNDIEEIIKVSSNFHKVHQDVDHYKSRLQGAINGRFIGCMLGAPVENWMVDDMEKFAEQTHTPFPPTEYWHDVSYREILHYKRDKKYHFSLSEMAFVVADDDVTYTVLNAVLLDKYGYALKADNIATFWKNHLPYACTAEYATMMGLRRNQSIDEIINSNPFVELIGAAIRADCFGYVCPGDPYQAALLAYQDAKITHKRNGIYGEMFVAATIAASFTAPSCLKAVEIGMNYIPDHCRLKEDLKWALSYDHKLKDYRHARQLLDQRFEKMNRVHTNNNMCAIVFSLILGEQDFTKTIASCIAMGYDNDCTGASVGSILGANISIENIDKKWYECFNDEIHTYIRGYETMKISTLVDTLIQIYQKNSQK